MRTPPAWRAGRDAPQPDACETDRSPRTACDAFTSQPSQAVPPSGTDQKMLALGDVFQKYRRPAHHTVKRIIGHHERHADPRGELRIELVEQRAAAGQMDAAAGQMSVDTRAAGPRAPLDELGDRSTGSASASAMSCGPQHGALGGPGAGRGRGCGSRLRGRSPPPARCRPRS